MNMLKKAGVLAGFGLAMAGGVAMAQVTPTPPPMTQTAPQTSPQSGTPAEQAPDAMRERMAEHGHWRHGHEGEHEGGHWGDHDGKHEMGPMGGHMGWMMRMHMMHRPPPPPSKAAHFRFRKGDAMVDIKCADDEPMKACVDAGSALLDKLAQQK